MVVIFWSDLDFAIYKALSLNSSSLDTLDALNEIRQSRVVHSLKIEVLAYNKRKLKKELAALRSRLVIKCLKNLDQHICTVDTRFSGGLNYIAVSLIMLVFKLFRASYNYSTLTQSLDI